MPGTNRNLQLMRRRLSETVGRLEFMLARSAPGADRSWLLEKLQRLRWHLQLIDIVLRNRRAEAGHRVVDLGRWRDANGAIHALPERSQSVAVTAGYTLNAAEPPTAG